MGLSVKQFGRSVGYRKIGTRAFTSHLFKKGIMVGISLLLLLSLSFSGQSRSSYKDPVKGASDPKVVIIEFSDFQCPACKAMYPVLKEIVKKYPEEVMVAYKNYPLTRVHRWAYTAAVAGECAYRREKFWEYHDLLFERQKEWANSRDARVDFLNMAEELGMDRMEFLRCMESKEIKDSVSADMEEGRRLNIHSTPTFFINGKRYVGVFKPWEFDYIVRKALEGAR